MYNFHEDVSSNQQYYYGGSSNIDPLNGAVSYPFVHHNQPPPFIMIPHPPLISPPVPPFSEENIVPKKDERYPQWNNQETKDFIEIRAQVEWDDTTGLKRTKNLWKMVVNRLSDKGYSRTIEQCKCKWKSLVNRYKGLDAMDLDNGRPCPFFSELHAVFTARANRMQQAQTEGETSSMIGKKKRKINSEDQCYEDFSDELESEEETDVDQVRKEKDAPKRKTGKGKKVRTESLSNVDNKNSNLAILQETMREFFQQQQNINMQMQELMEKRQKERNLAEQEWRETMEKLERERIVMEQAWREREEQRKLREESRAERRDALLAALLNKLIQDENP